MSLEHIIFNNLILNEEYARKVMPFLQSVYFHDYADKAIFNTIHQYVDSYSSFPSREALAIELSRRKDLNDDQFELCKQFCIDIPENRDQDTSLEWLLDSTEKFCQDKAIYNAILTSMKILDDESGNSEKGSIPELLSDALSVSFDTNIGHDFLFSAESRYDYYHRTEEKIPFDLEIFNKITKGGLTRKEMHVIIAPTGVGKSMLMCHMAAANLTMGKNVLYITLEMSEDRIAERIDQNLLRIDNDSLKDMPKDIYLKKVKCIQEKTVGKLIIKEYPTGSAGSANFRYLIKELKTKKGFMPDVIYVDYLNICCSSRLKGNTSANTYSIVKSIAEELRGLGVEFNCAVVSATQTTRDGMYNSEIDLTNTSESIGITHTAGLIFAVVSTPQLEELNQLMIIQLKNRYNDLNYYRKFVIGVDRSKMTSYNVEQSANKDTTNDSSNSYDNNGGFNAGRSTSKFDSSKFEGFK